VRVGTYPVNDLHHTRRNGALPMYENSAAGSDVPC